MPDADDFSLSQGEQDRMARAREARAHAAELDQRIEQLLGDRLALRKRVDVLEEALRALVVSVDEGPASLVRACMKDARAALGSPRS